MSVRGACRGEEGVPIAATLKPMGNITAPRHSQVLSALLSSPLQLPLADTGYHVTGMKCTENKVSYIG